MEALLQDKINEKIDKLSKVELLVSTIFKDSTVYEKYSVNASFPKFLIINSF